MKNRHKTYSNEDLAKIAKGYDIFSDFRKKEVNAYTVAQKRGILDDICSHMTVKRKVYQKYDETFNFENCQKKLLYIKAEQNG